MKTMVIDVFTIDLVPLLHLYACSTILPAVRESDEELAELISYQLSSFYRLKKHTKDYIFNHLQIYFAFFLQNICIYQKNVVPLHRSPGNSSPRHSAGEESGFFLFDMTELEIITSAFSAQRKNVSAPCNTFRRLRNRIFHQEAICWDLYYVSCLHDNLVTVLGWMNANMPDWLDKIDPFNKVCADIRKEMGW